MIAAAGEAQARGDRITIRYSDPVQTIRRPRLERRLKSVTSRRLLALTAGPGCGKTTLLAQHFGQGKAAWHTATPLDTSLSVFVLNLVERIRLLVPALTTDLRNALGGPTGPDVPASGRRVESLAAELAQELDHRLSRDLVLVVDDIHELGPESARFLASLCRHAPPRFHMVIASREPIPFPTARMEAAGEVDEITANELWFDLAELEIMVEAVLGAADSPTAETLLARTNGWPVAVNMMLRNMAESGSVGDPAEAAALFDYLAEELFAGESDDTVEALATVVDLPWVNNGLLTALGVGELEPIATDASNPYFSRRPDIPNAWTVSPLIGEYLKRRHPREVAARRSLLGAASRWYLANDHLAEALACHRIVGPSPELVELLAERGPDLLTAGLARHVLPLLESMGEERDDDLMLLEAEARQILGDWEQAMDIYRRLEPGDSTMPPRLAWRLGFLQHMRGDVSGALDTYRRGELGTGDHSNEAALLGWMASAYWLRGERDQSKQLADRALALAVEAGASQALATAHTVLAMVAALDGDRAANDLHYLRALEHAERAGDVLQMIRIRSNRGSRFLEEGDFGPAVDELDAALRLADMTGFELWRGMALSNRAQIAGYQGHLDEAISDLRQARTIFRSIGSSLEAYPVAHLGHVYATRGDVALARSSFEEAIRIADSQSDLQALVPALTGLARLLTGEDPDRAEQLALRAGEARTVQGRAGSVIALAEVALARGDRERAAALADEAATLASSRNDLVGVADALELAALVAEDPEEALRLLEQARQVWDDIGAPIGVARVSALIGERTGGAVGKAMATSAAESLGRLGAKGPALEARRIADALSRPASGSVAIRTLGGFEVLVDGEPVPGSVWQSKVARDILGMLVASRGRPIHREVLMDRLWPDEDPKKTANRLSVALATIRRVLDPEKRHDTNHHLRSDSDALSLSPDHLAVDVELFLDEFAQGRALLREGRRAEGMAVLASAEERYVGDFLEGNPFDDWAIPLREEARTAYVEIASTLAEAERDAGDLDSATRRYLRILERDPYHEAAHVALVAVTYDSGRHGTARRLYASYVSRMAELDIEPKPFPS